jgi:large subunit ribosomal protein L13
MLGAKSFLAKPGSVESSWYLVDADGAILGRLAVKVAMILMGKHKASYTPHVDTGDHVVVINCEKIRLSGNKPDAKYYDYFTGYPSGLKTVSFRTLMAKRPEKVIELAVKRMLPKNRLGRQMFKKLKVYRGSTHNHSAQKPEKLEL